MAVLKPCDPAAWRATRLDDIGDQVAEALLVQQPVAFFTNVTGDAIIQ